MTAKSRNLLIKLVISLGLLGFLAWKIDLTESITALRQMRYNFLVLVIGLAILDRLIVCYRVLGLLHSKNIDIRFSELARLSWTCDFASIFLPGSLAGDAMRIYTLSKGYSEMQHAISVIAMERLLGILSILSAGIIGAALGASSSALEPKYLQGVLAISLLAFVGIISVLIVGPRILKMFKKSDNPLLAKMKLIVGSFFDFRNQPFALLWAYLLSLAIQFNRVAIIVCLAWGLGIQAPLLYYPIFVPMAILVNMLPISFGGWGVQEGAYMFFLSMVGVPTAKSFVLSVLSTLTTIFVALPGVYFYFKYGLGKKAADPVLSTSGRLQKDF